MADGGDALTVRLVERIADIAPSEWDACAGRANPFLSHAFLDALEASSSACREAGWLPQHLLAEDAGGRIVGVAPMYLKSHSQGEYVFDHGWADAYQRAGGRYYPKLQVTVPFTPVAGRRLLLRPEYDTPGPRAALIGALAEIARRRGVSSLHVTFCAAEEIADFRSLGWLIRQGIQFHWQNRGYASFDDFLASLNHAKRKAIRKERREVAVQGIAFEVLSGAEIKAAHWDAFFDFYIATGERKWGSPYLTRDFFHRLGAALAPRVALVMAAKDGHWVAGALNLIGADALYGRYWGCRGEFKHLHFETSYYQAIEFAIARGLERVEAGAQGEHKLQRGYLPYPTWSAHWIRDAGFRKAVEQFLARETALIERERAELGAHSPFRREALSCPPAER